MNRENVLNFANEIFDNVDQINEDVFKAELTFGTGSTAGVYYLDFSQEFDDINFKEYQQLLVGKEYFKNRGSLQWNYYLLILQDNLEKTKKFEIESDDQYARKYVFNEAEFIDFFTIEKTKGSVEQDVTNKWKRELDDINFSEVYSKVPMTKAVEKYIDGKTQKAKIPDFFEGKEKLEIKEIDQLVLTQDYREFPEEHRDLRFGKANLFYGINGVGKTSLFESIEMILCGKTLRNPDVLEEEGAIKAYFNSSAQEFSYLPNNTDVYKSRDLFWYANPKSRGTTLVESFNRFNYFNSDAAYEFAKSDNEESIRSALYNLVLGPEYNHLKERVEKIWTTHIRPELNRLNKSIKAKRDEIKSADNELVEIKVNENIKIIENAIIEGIDKLQLKIELDNLEENYPSLELKLNEIEVLLNSIQNLFDEVITKKEIDEKSQSDSSFVNRLNIFVEKIKSLNKQKQTNKKKHQSLLIKRKALESVEKYYLNPDLFAVVDLQKRKAKIERKLNQIEKVTEKIDKVYFDFIKHQDEKSKHALESLFKTQRKLKKDQQILSEKVQGILNQYGKIDRINKQILQLGKDFLELCKDTTECPLCLTHFEADELARRVNRALISDAENSSEELTDLNNEQKRNQKELDKLSREVQAINLLKECLSKLDVEDTEIDKKSIKENIHILNEELSKKEFYKKQMVDIEKLEDKVSEHNASESELIVLQDEINSLFPNLEFSKSGVNIFKELKIETLDQLSSLDNSIDELTKSIVLVEEKFKREEELESEMELDIKSLKKEQEVNTQKISKAQSLFKDLDSEMKLDKIKSINEYYRTINLISKNLIQFKEELKNRNQIKFWEKQKINAQKFIDSNKNKLQRLKSASKTLKSIREEMDSNKHLVVFFKSNLKEIFDIFRTIHVPKEFKTIEFVNGEISLTDVAGDDRKISEISTGQRSALALSIFLCLNRKLQNGPNIILFDDPVSFIDDFNALSFLDFLRYFVLHEKKQLFFATANIKLASLFKKKFSFLQEDFEHWEFKRTILT